MELITIIIGWVAWIIDVYLAISFAHGCRLCAKQGRQCQMATALQTTIFWIVACLFILVPLSKIHILWILFLTYIHLIILWLTNYGLPKKLMQYIPSPIHILLRVPLTKFVVSAFMYIILLGVFPKTTNSQTLNNGN
jgi:hypothetical protein